MPNEEQRQLRTHELEVPNSINDSIIELSLKLAAAARKRSPKTWPVTHLLTKDDEE